jgi:hypothetical protein
MNKIRKIYIYIITADIKSFFYIIPIKIQALTIFLYACILEICCQFTEPVFNLLLHFFIATHACACKRSLLSGRPSYNNLHEKP